MHLIRRWDKKHGAEVVRSKSKQDGPAVAAQYQCECTRWRLRMPRITRAGSELCSDNGIKIELAIP